MIKQYDVIQLTQNLNSNIKKGLKGVVIEVYDSEIFEIEFVDENGFNIEYNGISTFTVNKTILKKG